LADERFVDRTARWLNRGALDDALGLITRTHDARQLTAALQAAGVAAFPSLNARDLVEDPHLRMRETIVDLVGPQGKSRSMIGAPWRFDKTPVRMERWMPGLGEHNEYVFGELLGLSTAQIKALAEEEVIY